MLRACRPDGTLARLSLRNVVRFLLELRNHLSRRVSSRLLTLGIVKKRRLRKLGLIRRFVSALGPGVTAGAADDDPSGIATYSIVGAQLGTSLLWTALITWPLMAG